MQYFRTQPLPLSTASWEDTLESHQLTYEFYDEINHRQDFEAYCNWYYATAQRNRAEAESMKNDINILGWFCR